MLLPLGSNTTKCLDTVKISLLHATRRPEAAKKCQQFWLDRAEDRANVEIITAIDAGDEACREAFPDAAVSTGEGACAAWNEAAKHATGDILVVLDDDWECPHGWDELIVSLMCNGADILHVGDKHRKDDLICHPIISRRFYDTIGYVWHPGFKSVYCDNWFTTMAREWGYVDATEGGTVNLGFLHANPSQGYGQEDDVARISNSGERYAHGKAVFDQLTRNNVVLAFTAYNRVDFLKRSLDSWRHTNLNLVTSVQFFIEPSDQLAEILEVISIFKALCPVPVIVHVNSEKYGVLRNPWELFDNLFNKQLAQFVILGEDDFLVSPDTLDFFEAMRGQMNDATMAICAKWVGAGANREPASWHRTNEFTGNVWGTSKQVWNSFLRDTWDFDYGSGTPDAPESGWDWNIGLRVMPRNGLHCIVPTASRSYHIGTVGVHCTEEDYQATTTHNFVSAEYKGAYVGCSKGVSELRVSSTGDLGDIVVMLATLKATGKQCDVCLRNAPNTAGILHRVHLIKPLLEAQPYIGSVNVWKDEELHWESEKFRHYGYINNGLNLAHNHAQAAVQDGFISELPDVRNPWLTVEPDTRYADRVIVNRSFRYNNDRFPWAKIVEHYGGRILFIGLPEEYVTFCERFGAVVHYQPTKDLLEVAQIIAGSALFIGNQSSCMTVAEGLKHPRIQEVCLTQPDCIYPPGTGAQYVADGNVRLPDGTVLKGNRPPAERKTAVTPPGGWKYPGHDTLPIFEVLVKIVARGENLTNEEAANRVYDANVERCPEFFTDRTLRMELQKFNRALEQYPA